jgi:hypothetical protein
MTAVRAARGVRRSPTQTVITPSTPGVDCFGQTRRTSARPNGQLGPLQMTPRTVSFQALKARVNARCQPAAGPPRPRASRPCPPGCGGGRTITAMSSVARHAPPATTSSGDGSSGGPSGATRTTPGTGSLRATFPINRGPPGGSPIQPPGNGASAFGRWSNRSATSRSTGTPPPSTRQGRRPFKAVPAHWPGTRRREFGPRSCDRTTGGVSSAHR